MLMKQCNINTYQINKISWEISRQKIIEDDIQSPTEEIVLSFNVAKLKEELKSCGLSRNGRKKALQDYLIMVQPKISFQ